ncbi:hypothetical protein ACIQM0_04235 [Streptomyces sp. NPDC091387]|uniref:hypothetical protein n=1 Tax=Streptomyces sp. NPDC091387 TaxID=3365998 RepID=UPI0038211E4A
MTAPFADPSFARCLLLDAQEAGIARFVVAAIIADGERVLLLRRPTVIAPVASHDLIHRIGVRL